MQSIKSYQWVYGKFNPETCTYEGSCWKKLDANYRVDIYSEYHLKPGIYVDVNRQMAFVYSEDFKHPDQNAEFENTPDTISYNLPTYTLRHFKLYKTNTTLGHTKHIEDGICIAVTGCVKHAHCIKTGERIPVLDKYLNTTDEEGYVKMYRTDGKEYPIEDVESVIKPNLL